MTDRQMHMIAGYLQNPRDPDLDPLRELQMKEGK